MVHARGCPSATDVEGENNVSGVSSGESKGGYSNVPCSLLFGFVSVCVLEGSFSKQKVGGNKCLAHPRRQTGRSYLCISPLVYDICMKSSDT